MNDSLSSAYVDGKGLNHVDVGQVMQNRVEPLCSLCGKTMIKKLYITLHIPIYLINQKFAS